jgi:2-polyprenyl-6-methoxyphenol hydroxylase-like FAD-dependent oxidoreductase
VVGADGYRSMVRRTVAPDQPDATFAGYMLWRGLTDEADLPPQAPRPSRAADGCTTKAPPDERGGNRYVQPKATAPHLDYPRLPTSRCAICRQLSGVHRSRYKRSREGSP